MLTAFHNDEKIKTKYLKRVSDHAEKDQIVKGKYWQRGKGCAVGCTIHGDDHRKYETELGVPEWLARVEDTVFEGLPNERAMKWPLEFLEAIPLGVDLNQIKTPFIVFILENCIESMNACVFDREKNTDVVKAIEGSKAAVREMIRCHKEGLDLSAADSAADSARSAAYSAARSAAYSAARSAAYSARSAAYSAARSAAYSAADSAADSARSAADSAADSARSAAYEKYADKLLELIRACK